MTFHNTYNIIITFLITLLLNPCYSQKTIDEINNQAIEEFKHGSYEKAKQMLEEIIKITKDSLGETHPDYITAVTYLALLYERNLNGYKEVFSEISTSYLPMFFWPAELYEEIGNYDKAITLYSEALSILKENQEYKHHYYSGLLNKLSSIYYKIGEYNKAEPLLIELAEIKKSEFGEQHQDYGEALYDLAEVYIGMKNYVKAESYLIALVENAKTTFGEKSQNYARTLEYLAELYYKIGAYSNAEQIYIELINIEKEMFGKIYSGNVYSLCGLADLYRKIGKYEEAEQVYIKAVEVYKTAFGDEHPDYATSLDNLAGLYMEKGNYAKAEQMFVEAMNIRKKTLGLKHPKYATSLNNLALLYLELGNYKNAKLLFLEALNIKKEVLGEKNHSYAITLQNLALYYYTLGNYSEAEVLYTEVLDILREIVGVNHPDYILVLNSLASLYEEMGNYVMSMSYNIQSINKVEATLGKEHYLYSYALNNLAILNIKIGQLAEAEPFLVKSLNLNKQIYGETHPYYVNSLYHLAALFNMQGNLEKAATFFKKANDIQHQLIIMNFGFLSEKEKELYINTIQNNFEIYNSFILEYVTTNPPIASELYDNTLALKGMLLEESRKMSRRVLNSKDSSVVNTFREYQRVKRQLSEIYSLPLKDRYLEPEKLEEKANQLEKILIAISNDFKDSSTTLMCKWKDIKEHLDENEAAIEFINFHYFNKKYTDSIFYCALVIRPDYELPKMVYLFEEKELENIVKQRENIEDYDYVKYLYGWGEGKSDTIYKGYTLYKTIWQPLDSLLKGVKTVYISPSGILHKISFCSIPNSVSTVLSDTYQINYVISTRVIAMNKEPKTFFNKESFITLYGGINYNVDSIQMIQNSNTYQKQNKEKLLVTRTSHIPEDTVRGNIWFYLNGTLNEVNKIKGLFEINNVKTHLFTKDSANEESFKVYSNNTAPTVIHFATHGFFFPHIERKHEDNINIFGQEKEVFKYSENPLFRSGLILAGANRAWTGKESIPNIEDGILTAYEVSNTNLKNTRLVVMSACETGLGDIKGSEGVFGLQRAFKMAGVDYIIMTLWEIADKKTVEFMESFYNNLLNGKEIRIAFNLTQKEMKKKYDPYYWAAFILIE
ncbi:MAG: hypothetical protein A2X08_15240 [Bacteroidetes bacterium GWA2_32_17]|nr:MAG: hypothetical protein A2X08_15240 [Bacteroidetes bacterium GWA2_32_17]